VAEFLAGFCGFQEEHFVSPFLHNQVEFITPGLNNSRFNQTGINQFDWYLVSEFEIV